MTVFLVSLILALLPFHVEEGFAKRFSLTPSQRSYLQQVDALSIKAVALTENGSTDASSITQVVRHRMQTLGYTIDVSSSHPHKVLLKVKCEERKTWVGPSRTGEDADMPGAPARLWKGPACLLTYFIDNQQGPWEHEVRTDFQDAIAAAAHDDHNQNPGRYALNALKTKLQTDDFPLRLSAHWGQTARLVQLLQSPNSSRQLKLTIMSLASALPGPGITQALQEALADPDLAPAAVTALGQVGDDALPILFDLIEHSESVDVQAASVRALGEMGSRSGNVQIIPPLIALLKKDNLDLRVQTEIVRALGKVPDQQSIPWLEDMNRKAWTSRSNDPQMQELREAVVWSLWQVNPSAHTD